MNLSSDIPSKPWKAADLHSTLAARLPPAACHAHSLLACLKPTTTTVERIQHKPEKVASGGKEGRKGASAARTVRTTTGLLRGQAGAAPRRAKGTPRPPPATKERESEAPVGVDGGGGGWRRRRAARRLNCRDTEPPRRRRRGGPVGRRGVGWEEETVSGESSVSGREGEGRGAREQ